MMNFQEIISVIRMFILIHYLIAVRYLVSQLVADFILIVSISSDHFSLAQCMMFLT
jgi:hypothetical protein